MRAVRFSAVVAILALFQSVDPLRPAVAADSQVRMPDGERPPILDRLESFDGLTALALGPGGQSVALAVPSPKPQRTEVRLYSSGVPEPLSITVTGEIRDLLYTGEGDLYGLLHKPSKRGQGETSLVSLETDRLRVRHLMRMPPSARALDEWNRQGAVVIACRDELRTVFVPEIRSGPLFRVSGENRAVAVAGVGDAVMLAQRQELLLVNLADPPQAYELPVRERVAAPASIVELAASRNGRHALARAADGRLYTVDFSTLELDRHDGSAVGLAAPAKRSAVDRGAVTDDAPSEPAAPDVPRPTAPPETDAAPPPVTTNVPATDEIESTAAPPAGSASGEATGAAITAAAEEADAPTQTAAETPEDARDSPSTGTPSPSAAGAATSTAIAAAAAEVDAPTPIAAETPPDAFDDPARGTELPPAEATPDAGLAFDEDSDPPTGPLLDGPETHSFGPEVQAWGLITGQEFDQVEAVVVMGPNNILHEATRVRPGPDHVWTVGGLDPGRYRVQLAAAGGRVLVTVPPFASLEVKTDGQVQVPDFRVLRKL